MDIYSINSWATTTLYEEDSIVLVGNLYYYATARHVSGATFAADLTSGLWTGYLTNDSEQKPYFSWKPSYRYSLDIKPSVKSIRFGDGYENRFADGIQNIMLPLDLTFENRSLAQYSAILHFLQTRNGVEKFYFIAPQPFGVVKKFICDEWNATQNFYENYTVTAKFSERN